MVCEKLLARRNWRKVDGVKLPDRVAPIETKEPLTEEALLAEDCSEEAELERFDFAADFRFILVLFASELPVFFVLA